MSETQMHSGLGLGEALACDVSSAGAKLEHFKKDGCAIGRESAGAPGPLTPLSVLLRASLLLDEGRNYTAFYDIFS